MTDRESRGRILMRLYELSKTTPGDIDWRLLTDLGFPFQTLGRYLEQLKDLGLIDAKFLRDGGHGGFAAVTAKINVHGSEAIENPQSAPSQVVINRNINVHGAGIVQIGDHNQQTVNIDIEKITAAIDRSSATIQEKDQAKSILQQLFQNNLLLRILQSWFAGTPPTG